MSDKFVGSRLLCIFAALHHFGKPVAGRNTIIDQVVHPCMVQSCLTIGINANGPVRFTNGFPKILVAEILEIERDMSLNFTTRLVPGMTFTCRGTILGVTVAGRPRQDRPEDPIIQIWRPKDRNNPISYYNTGSNITISETVCAGTPSVTFLSDNDYGVWHYHLNVASQVSVESGDIIGLLLPPREQSSFYVSIAKASRGPTNYMIVGQQALSLPEINLCNQVWTSSNEELPQIAIEVKSGIHTILVL